MDMTAILLSPFSYTYCNVVRVVVFIVITADSAAATTANTVADISLVISLAPSNIGFFFFFFFLKR